MLDLNEIELIIIALTTQKYAFLDMLEKSISSGKPDKDKAVIAHGLLTASNILAKLNIGLDLEISQRMKDYDKKFEKDFEKRKGISVSTFIGSLNKEKEM